MLSKNKIKYIQSLQRKKYRQRYNKFIVEGTKMLDEILVEAKNDLQFIICTEKYFKNKENLLSNVEVQIVLEKDLKNISSLKTPQEVLAVMEIPSSNINEQILKNDVSIYLDAIQDPGNLGTIIRIADWFGIHHIFLGEGTVDAFNPKSIQSSMSSFFRVQLINTNINDFKNNYPDLPIYLADMNGENVYEQTIKKGLVVIGNEGNGISKEWFSLQHQVISIPSFGNAESLNAAVATGIITALIRRS